MVIASIHLLEMISGFLQLQVSHEKFQSCFHQNPFEGVRMALSLVRRLALVFLSQSFLWDICKSSSFYCILSILAFARHTVYCL